MMRTNRIRRVVGVGLWLSLVLNVSITWLASAQQQGGTPARGAAPPSRMPSIEDGDRCARCAAQRTGPAIRTLELIPTIPISLPSPGFPR